MYIINYFNWFWAVADHPDGVYSSKTNTYVAADDPELAAWGQTPIPIPDEVELWSVMSANEPHRFKPWLFNGATFVQPAVGAYTAEQLAAYAGDVRWQAEITGVSGGTAYRTDRVSRALLNTTLSYLRANTAVTVQWKALDGTFTTLDAAGMETFNNDVNTHVELCYETERGCKADIDAGTITTLAEIDALFAPLRQLAWNESYRKEW